MPFTNRGYAKLLSDLVVNELDPKVGYARQVINVTPPASSGTLKFGQVVFRAKSDNPAAPYAVLSAAADLALTNEYAVVFGDEYGLNEEFVPKTISATLEGNAVSFLRGPVALKEFYIKQVAQDSAGAALTDAEFGRLKELLSKQGVIVEPTLVAL